MTRLNFNTSWLFVTFLMVTSLRASSQTRPLNVAVLIYKDVQIIDYTGPYEVFGQMRPSNVFTVAESYDPITTRMGMKVVPNYTFSDSPAPNILVVPGGTVDVKNKKIIQWIKERYDSAAFILAVCNGAFFLAEAGLLDGKEATTTAMNLERFESLYPKVKVVKNRRFVDTGKITTSAGLSAGIDASIHLVERIGGLQRAKNLARGIEYNWDPLSPWTRSQLADMHFMTALMEIYMSGFTEISTEENDGNTDEWLLIINFSANESLKAVETRIVNIFNSTEGWNQQNNQIEVGTTLWAFNGYDNEAWSATTRLTKAQTLNKYNLSISVTKDRRAK